MLFSKLHEQQKNSYSEQGKLFHNPLLDTFVVFIFGTIDSS